MNFKPQHRILSIVLLCLVALSFPLKAISQETAPSIIPIISLLLLTDDTGTVDPAILGTFNTLGIVTDAADQPINFATVTTSGPSGYTLETSSGGAFYGNMGTEASGWVHVFADGYAETYTTGLGDVNGVRIFETRLTPLGAWREFKHGTADTVAHESISVELPADLFAANTTVTVTDVAPENLDASYALWDDNIFYTFLRTFSITAQDENGNPAPFADGQIMPVTITLPQSVTVPPPLAYFDAESGVWIEVDNICTLDDNTHMTCDLPHLSVWGTAGQAAAGGGTPRTLPYPNPTTRAQAKANIRYGMAVTAEGMRSGDADMQADGEAMMAQGRDQYVQLSEAYAWAFHSKDESGKMALLDASAVNQLLGGSSVKSQQLNNDAGTIAENIGKELLKKPGCGKVREMMQSAAQIQLLNGSSPVSDDLLEKIDIAINTCDPWLGKISVRYYLADAMPLIPDYNRQDNVAWTESHDVALFSDPSSKTGDPAAYILTGDDMVDISMPETVYKTFLPILDCPDGFDEYTLFSSPAPASINLAIDGFYSPDSYGFLINSIEKAVLGGDTIDLTWTQLTRTYNVPGCVLAEFPQGPSSYVNGFESLIGSVSIQQNTPITLQDMLNNGSRYSSDVHETIFGKKTIQLSIPEFTIPWAAVQSVSVNWRFTHIKQQQ